MAKTLLFSLTKEDFEVETFCAGGKGGSHQNATKSAVRIRHRASGAVAECREERYQHTNKKRAFERLVKTKEFLNWHKLEVARRLRPGSTICAHMNEWLSCKQCREQRVDEAMKPENLKVEMSNG